MNEITIKEIPLTHALYGSKSFELTLANGGKYQLLANYSPFKNCQIFSIGGISTSIHANINDTNSCIKVIKQINKLFPDARKSTCIIDISKRSFEIIKDKKWIKYSMPYTNKTGNPMVIVLIDALTTIDDE